MDVIVYVTDECCSSMVYFSDRITNEIFMWNLPMDFVRRFFVFYRWNYWQTFVVEFTDETN